MNAALATARAISDTLMQPTQPIPGLEVTELPEAEGHAQFRLALQLSGHPMARDFQATQPPWLAD